ncbi:MAG: hypothetical protein ACUVRK_11325, partial [Spirochaetota bacterium]
MICSKSNIVSTRTDEIECDNNYFKISKPLPKELARSVLQYGIIEPVFLLKQNGQYIPVYGHNRIIAARESHVNNVPAKIITEFNLEDFLQIVRVKLYNNALGPMGKIKSLFILYDYFNADKKLIMAIARELSLPSPLIELNTIKSIIGLPRVII